MPSINLNGLDRYSTETKGKILKNLGKSDQEILLNFSTEAGTANQDAMHAAFAIKRAGVDEETANEELFKLYQVSYPDGQRDINRVIQKAYHPGTITSFKSKRRVIKPTVEKSRQNVKPILDSSIGALAIQQEAKKKPLRETLPLLYGDDLETLVCLAKSTYQSITKPLGEWLKLSEQELKQHQLRCANPMSKLVGTNKEGNESTRCEDNASESLDLLTYESDDRQRTENDSLKLINYLAQGLPLVSVCRSGNESIHATYSVKGLSDELKQRLKDRFAELGGDPSVMETYHLMRTPNAIRNDKKAKGVKQELLWINGPERTKEVDKDKLALIGIPLGDIVRTEVEESLLFQEFLGDDYLFNDTIGWLRWNEISWEKIGNSVLLNEAKSFQNQAIQRGEKNRAKMLGRKNTLQNIVDLTKVSVSPELKIEHLDSNPHLLGVANGTLDLKLGSQGFRKSNRDNMILRALEVEFDSDAKAPVWEAFLNRIFRSNMEIIPYIQRFCGYCLTGDVSEQIFVFLYGKGCNGKSTFIKTLEKLMGPYASKLPKAAYINTKNGKTDTALSHLEHARLAVGEELNEREPLAEGTVKTLSGGDRLQARRLHKMEFEFTPTHKFIMFGNHKPVITGCDDGIWRRIHLVPFAEKIEDDEKDPDLDQKLFNELPGILNWILQGCLDWKKKRLSPPKLMTKASQDYRGDEDIIQQFIDQCLDQSDPKARETREALFNHYQRWCEEDGAPSKTKKHFLSALRDRGIEEKGRNLCCSLLEDPLTEEDCI